MDARNEYRIRPSPASDAWYAEFRKPGWLGWSDWKLIGWRMTPEVAEALCRDHAGARHKYLGRLP